MLRAVAVHPDVIVRAGDGVRIHILVHAGLPAIAAIEIVARRQARIVVVVHRYRQAVARHGGIHVFEHHVAVVQVGIHRTRAARAHGLILPPAFQARVGNEVHVHRGRIARAGVRRIQLRIVVAAHVIRLAQHHAVVAAGTGFVVHAPVLVHVGEVEHHIARAGGLDAFLRFGFHVVRVGGVEVQPVHAGHRPGGEHLVRADVIRTGRRLHPHAQLRADHRITGLERRKLLKAQQAHEVLPGRGHADLHIAFRVRIGRGVLAQGGILDVGERVRGNRHRVDGDGEGRLRQERFLHRV